MMPSHDRQRISAIATLALAGIAACAMAVMPAQAQAQAPAPAPDKPVSVHYGVYVRDFHVVDAFATYNLTPFGYDIRTTMQTDGIWRLFMKMNIASHARGHIVNDWVAPELFDSSGYSRKQQRLVSIDYANGAPEVKQLSPQEPDRKQVTDDERAHAIDTLSAMMLVLSSVTQSGKCDGQSNIFDGLRLTSMTSHSAGTQDLPRDSRLAYHGPSLRCDFMGQQIAGFVRGGHEALMRTPQPGAAWFQNMDGYGFVAVRIEFNHPKLGKLIILLRDPPSHA